VVSLVWFNSLSADEQALITSSMVEAARFQRADNRNKNAARLALFKEKETQINEDPNIDVLRHKVEASKDMYADPRVQALLNKMLDTAK